MHRYICPECGAYLDPGEKCDCRDERIKRMKKRKANNLKMDELMEVEECSQIELNLYC